MKAPKSLLLALIVLATAALGAWFFQESEQTRSAPLATLLKEDRDPAGFTTPDLILLRGQRHDYELSYSGELPAGPETFRYSIQGILSITALDELQDSYKVAVRFRPEHITGVESFPEDFRKAWQAAISTTVPAELSRRGFKLQLSKRADLSPLALEFWQGLAQRIQIELPTTLDKRIYETEEHPYGTIVLVRYEIDSGVKLEALNSERVYIQKSFQSREGSDRQISGETLAVMREGLQGIYQMETKSQEALLAKGLNLPSKSELKLQWVGEERTPDEELVRLETAGTRSGEFEVEAAVQQQTLGVLTFPDIWSRIEALGSEAVVPQELYLQLKAWIFLHPADLGQLADKLRALGPTDGRLRNVVKALTAVGSPEAQGVIVDLLHLHLDRENSELAKRLATSLGFVKEPSPLAQKALQDIIAMKDRPDVRAQGALALGIMGHNLHKSGEDKRAAEVESDSKRLLDQAQTPQDVKHALSVMGNFGPSSRSVVDKFLASSDPEIRAQALFALRFCREEDTPEFLARTYAAEPADSSRKAIIQALISRPADSAWFAGVESILKTSITTDEQMQIAWALAKNARKGKEQSLRLLGTIELKNEDAAIRKQLSQYRNQAQSVTTF